MLKLISAYPEKIAGCFERYKFKDGTNEIMNLAREGNKYFNDSEPWNTIKTDKNKCGTTLNICLQAIYTLAELFEPVIPFSSEKVFKMLNSKPTSWKNSGSENLSAGHKLNKAEILFPKIEDKIIDEQIAKLGTDSSAEKEEELISYDDFMKTQLQVAEVIEAENVKKSKKLLKLKVRLGNGERQVIAGIAESYKPEDMVGKKVIVVENLQPAKLMGQESKGMILAVENMDGKLEIITVDKKVKNGTRVT
jgi:methionyl-tRNA synthetase